MLIAINRRGTGSRRGQDDTQDWIDIIWEEFAKVAVYIVVGFLLFLVLMFFAYHFGALT